MRSNSSIVVIYDNGMQVEKDVQLLQQLQSVFQDNSGSGSARVSIPSDWLVNLN